MYPIIFCNIDMFAQDAHIYKLTEKGVEDLGNCQIEEAITIAPQFCYQDGVHHLIFTGETKYIKQFINELNENTYNNFELEIEVEE